MYQIKRAIIMAAGKGERLRPVTDQIPKPLIKVNGVPMIETIIQALIQNGIREIYVVIGYLKEQFGYLCQQYGVIIHTMIRVTILHHYMLHEIIWRTP